MYFLNVRSLPNGGGVADEAFLIDDAGRMPPLQDLQTACNGKDVLFVTHGFNVPQRSGITSLMSWAELLQLGSTVVVGMLWPGDSVWVHALIYPEAVREATSSGDKLAAYINAHLQGAASVSFASHSLGARVVLQCIEGLSRRANHLLLMAGAVDDTCLTEEYQAADANVADISVLASVSDEVLQWAFPTGNFVSGIFSRGEPYVHMALGREGPATPYPNPNNVRAGWQIPKAWNYGHHNYLPSGHIDGSFPQPVVLPDGNPNPPPNGAPAQLTPPDGDIWQPAWSAGFQTTRW